MRALRTRRAHDAPQGETKEHVRRRASDRCEHCRVPQWCYPDFTFHVEHIVARQHRGSDDLDNLAFACHLCNNKKGPNLAGIAPDTGELTRLFHPRRDVWDEHFRLDGSGRLLGLTPIGRTTACVLDMNAGVRVRIRREIMRLEARRRTE